MLLFSRNYVFITLVIVFYSNSTFQIICTSSQVPAQDLAIHRKYTVSRSGNLKAWKFVTTDVCPSAGMFRSFLNSLTTLGFTEHLKYHISYKTVSFSGANRKKKQRILRHDVLITLWLKTHNYCVIY